jgi:hypothetical protein
MPPRCYSSIGAVIISSLHSPDPTTHTGEGTSGSELAAGSKPDWWTLAACRGDGCDRWMLEPGQSGKSVELAAICRACPVVGKCLEDGCREPGDTRRHGPFRIVTSSRWGALRKLVREWQPVSDDDWEQLAAWVVDDDLEVTRRGRKPAAVA